MKKIILSVLALIIAVMSTAVAVFGWLAVGTSIKFDNGYSGSVLSSYFASGDGSENDAFVINRANHLYNLAWLQNNGEFNNKTDESGNKKQFYFKITDDLDMRGYVLPPIGTKVYPFISKLDGGSKTIRYLTVSNVEKTDTMSNEVSPVPANMKGVIGSIYNDSTKNTNTDIVGFFGVIGHYPGTATCPNNVSVSNLYLDNLTVRTRTTNSLIGLFAGYVCGNVSNVGVYHSMVSIGSGVSTLSSSGYGAHSKYSLIGDFDEKTTGWKDTESGSSGGAGAGFGGSIDMQLLSRRVGYMITSILANNTNNFSTNSYAYQVTSNKNVLTSSGCLDIGANYNLNVYKRGSYMPVSDSGFYYKSASITSTNNKYLECLLGTETYLPLNIDLEAMHLTDKYGEIKEDGTLTAISGTYYYNDIYKNGIDGARKEAVNVSNTGYIVGGDAGTNYVATAYVRLKISHLNYGSNSTDKYIAGETIYKSLRYTISSSSPYTYSNGVNSTVQYTGTNLDLVTNVGGAFYRIKDTFNEQETTTPVLSFPEKTPGEIKLNRYDSVRTQFGEMLSDNLIYGLKFTRPPSSSATIKGSNVSISGETYDSYELIKSAINFNLSQPGYMTAVLGGYDSDISYSYNQFGFSLFEVVRDKDNNIVTDTKEKNYTREITSVWQNDSGDILYKDSATAVDNTAPETGYTKVYDKYWYNDGDDGQIQHGTAYYVEIPLKSGDYCLGGVTSDSNKNNAYLMYLDIGANGGGSGSGGSSSTTTYKIDTVRFVYLLNGAYGTLKDFYAFEIVRKSTDSDVSTDSGVQIYFLMKSSAMCYCVTIDTANTAVKLTDSNLSATNTNDFIAGYGGTNEAPS